MGQSFLSTLNRVYKKKSIDTILDIEHDIYGSRMVTCSSDNIVKVWDHSDTGEPKCTAQWKAHNAAVNKVIWAHPKFGQVIVTCSRDKTAIVWVESLDFLISYHTFKEDCDQNKSCDSVWVNRYSFECSSSVTDIKFSPNISSLVLAICCSNGVIEIYEARCGYYLRIWTKLSIIECNAVCSCISFNPYFENTIPLIAIGCDDRRSNINKVIIYSNERKNEWIKLKSNTVLCPIIESVRDISFAPNTSRSYALLVVATDKNVRIISFDWKDSQNYELYVMVDLYAINTKVWRVSWNINGNMIALFKRQSNIRVCEINEFEKCREDVAVIKGNTFSLFKTSNSRVKDFRCRKL